MALKLIPPGKRKGNKHYIARGMVEGQQVEVVCRDEDGQKTKDKAAARRFRAKLEAELYRSPLASGTPKTWGQAADAYIARKSPSKNDQRYLEKLRAVLGKKALSAIRQHHIDEAARLLYPGRRNTIKNDQVYEPAGRILHYAAKNGWCHWLRVEKLKAETPKRQRPDEGARDTLLAATSGLEHLLLAHLFYQGWRISETLGLAWDNPKKSRVKMRDRLFVAWIPKAQAWKEIPMSDEVFPLYANTHPKKGYVFPWRTRWQVYEWLRPLCDNLGVEFTPHMARRLFASNLNKLGASRYDITDVSSWTSPKSVDPYVKTDMDHSRKVLNRLSKPQDSGRKSGKAG